MSKYDERVIDIHRAIFRVIKVRELIVNIRAEVNGLRAEGDFEGSREREQTADGLTVTVRELDNVLREVGCLFEADDIHDTDDIDASRLS